jgi:hypothetical protein
MKSESVRPSSQYPAISILYHNCCVRWKVSNGSMHSFSEENLPKVLARVAVVLLVLE